MKINTIYGIEEAITRKCIYCCKEKPLEEFNKHKGHYSGFDSRCRECKIKRQNLVGKIKKISKPMTEVCECCGKKPNAGMDIDPSRRKRSLVLDHDHITGQFRGWLCSDCNTAIGALGDNIEGLQKAIDYLKRMS